MNTHQWSLAKQSGFKTLKMIARKCQIKVKPKGMVLLTHKITISVNFNT